ncbi:hypothetical protein [Micromonospora auratinigra]|uniref:Uncharacterized protein n=1 Tax=Micromonospora auratinigra TaxID=261654 RepID=A0A1A8ZP98_9ACTN|nr:hypothetical protein [Micromonospora auratinigra]SBT45718.1 hypothetical protein GA0070611_3120 [Micromonospora auratinigra]
MGSSYLEYRGSGFWVRDYQAEVWLYLLAQEAEQAAAAHGWLTEARDDWHMQATAGFMGCVSSCLDEHLAGAPDRVAVVLDLSERVLQRLRDWSPAVPKDLVNSFGTGGEQETFDADLSTGPLLACGRAFVSLLRGEFPPDHAGWAR